MSEIQKKSHYLKIAISVFGMLMPAFYLIGISYHNGTLEGYGLNSSAFPLTVQEAYESAYYYSLQILLNPFHALSEIFIVLTSFNGLIILVFFVLFLWVTLWLLIKYIKKEKDGELLKLKKAYSFLNPDNNDATKTFSAVVYLTYKCIILFTMIMVLMVFWLGIFVFPYKMGRDNGKNTIEKFEQTGCVKQDSSQWNNCIALIVDNTEIIKGLYLYRNDKEVAIYNNKQTTIMKFPDQYTIVKNRTPQDKESNHIETK